VGAFAVLFCDYLVARRILAGQNFQIIIDTYDDHYDGIFGQWIFGIIEMMANWGSDRT
jgi:hypothetical protein